MNGPRDLSMCAYAGDSVASPEKVFNALKALEKRIVALEGGKENHFANVNNMVPSDYLIDTLLKLEDEVNTYRVGGEHARARLYVSAIADWLESQNNVGLCDAMDCVQWLREEVEK